MGWPWKRTRRDTDAEIHQPLTPEQRERARAHARMKLQAAKAQYIAGHIDFEELYAHWWRADISRRPVYSMKSALHDFAQEVIELERARRLPPKVVTKHGTFATGGVIPTPPGVPLERRGNDWVIPKAAVREMVDDLADLPVSMKPNLPTPRTQLQATIATAVRGMTVDMSDGRA